MGDVVQFPGKHSWVHEWVMIESRSAFIEFADKEIAKSFAKGDIRKAQMQIELKMSLIDGPYADELPKGKYEVKLFYPKKGFFDGPEAA